MKKQFIVQEKNIGKRKSFYNFLLKNGFHPIDNYQMYLNNKFPFVIETNNNFWICNSITCCACAAQNRQIKTIDEFKYAYKNIRS